MAKLGIASTSLEFPVINREIYIPKREIGRCSLFDQKSGDLPPNRETWKLCAYRRGSIEKDENRQIHSETIQDEEITISRTSYTA